MGRGGGGSGWRGVVEAGDRGGALRLEHGTLNQKNPGSNPLAAVLNFGQFCPFHTASFHAAV